MVIIILLLSKHLNCSKSIIFINLSPGIYNETRRPEGINSPLFTAFPAGCRHRGHAGFLRRSSRRNIELYKR